MNRAAAEPCPTPRSAVLDEIRREHPDMSETFVWAVAAVRGIFRESP